MSIRACAAVGLAAIGLVLAGCIHPPTYQPITSEVVPVTGFRIDRPGAIVSPNGLRFHGWACRRWPGFSAPRALRLERIDGSGQVVATARGGLNLPNRPGCTIYDIPTRWFLAPGDRVRLCAAKDAQPCPKPSASDRR